MEIYLTNGTESILKKIVTANEKEKLVLMQNRDTCLLVHETDGLSFFKEPRRYEVIGTYGPIKAESGFAVFQHISVTDEGRPLFEYHYKNQITILEKQLGILAVRILRPRSSSDSYIVFTLWKNETYYNIWQASELYKKVNLKYEGKKAKNQAEILLRPSFTRTYYIYKEKI